MESNTDTDIQKSIDVFICHDDLGCYEGMGPPVFVTDNENTAKEWCKEKTSREELFWPTYTKLPLTLTHEK